MATASRPAVSQINGLRIMRMTGKIMELATVNIATTTANPTKSWVTLKPVTKYSVTSTAARFDIRATNSLNTILV